MALQELNPFSGLVKQLSFCDKLLIEHQISLMHKNYEQALLQFEQLYEIRTNHLQMMEEKLLPIYKSLLAKFPAGGRPLYFVREKKLILKDLKKHVRFIGQLVLHPQQIKLDLVRLFEEYAWLKDLLDHHDAREKMILFPGLVNEMTEENIHKLFDEISQSFPKIEFLDGKN